MLGIFRYTVTPASFCLPDVDVILGFGEEQSSTETDSFLVSYRLRSALAEQHRKQANR